MYRTCLASKLEERDGHSGGNGWRHLGWKLIVDSRIDERLDGWNSDQQDTAVCLDGWLFVTSAAQERDVRRGVGMKSVESVLGDADADVDARIDSGCILVTPVLTKTLSHSWMGLLVNDR
eukprot:CAMPEP_0198117060 /NCGR_PEP_ID=MMETSP1442-20131203/16300_1 /TAXON_ID= /ORGANISM="Craspedostauros australis, Strain CCMP3328" /LENGTH=119 /DNA_ID=CAMNT_0043775025 /DNA_START=91 /DNA_END=450 /DNA_ORIENTATION=-